MGVGPILHGWAGGGVKRCWALGPMVPMECRVSRCNQQKNRNGFVQRRLVIIQEGRHTRAYDGM